ncbi:MAG TPA: homoserine O-succinyltransferase [Terriglobia bacterium]|nr:homoserine O-succinyltransferase [Terriglobia bacterium]
MPVRFNTHPSAPNVFDDSDPNCLDIGLVNNMPDSALQATERQFLALLEAAAEGMMVRLTPYALPEVPRADAGRCHINSYFSINDLWNRALDGLIVTGMEPCAVNLIEEPYWPTFTRLMDWAEENTASSIWSCLAAHAAALHSDGIRRFRLNAKRSGIFDCARASDHQLTRGTTDHFPMPHSRWNDLPEEALTGSGYVLLTRSAAGVDSFVKQRKSLFVFFQGHPEYEADTLLLEYRRDVKRFLKGESNIYPSMPQSYFDDHTAAAWTSLRERALSGRREELIGDLPAPPAPGVLACTWRPDAVRLYRNWLLYMSERKHRRSKASSVSRQPVQAAAR